MPDTTDEYTPPADDQDEVVDLDTATPDVKADRAETDPEPPADDQPAEDKPSSKREAKYRIQLRETEAERDQLRTTVENLQRAEVERLAAASIRKPTALWSTDVELSSLLDDAGRVDPDKVNAATKAAVETLGLAAKPAGGYVAREGMSIHRAEPVDPWSNAFKR